MTRSERGEKIGGFVEAGPGRRAAAWVAAFVAKTLVIAGAEARKLQHDPTALVTRAVQPALWMVVFGQVFTRLRAIPTGELSYLDFMTPGILAQSVLFIAIFHGITVIWERDLGVVHKLLVSPTPRGALVLGKALSAGMRAFSQAVIIYLLAVILGVGVDWSPLSLLGVLLAVILGAAVFSTFSLAVACLVKTRERFMGIGQVLTMPLFFASNAIYPIDVMPPWLQVVAHVNPLTYEVDALRALMLTSATSSVGLAMDFGVLLLALVMLLLAATRLYPSIVR